MNENKKLKRFKKYCNETILDFKDETILDYGHDDEYIVKQFQTVIDFEKVKPRIMPVEKAKALIFINQYLEQAPSSKDFAKGVESFLGLSEHDIKNLDNLERERQFMHEYINERYNFDGRMITLNKSHSFLKV